MSTGLCFEEQESHRAVPLTGFVAFEQTTLPCYGYLRCTNIVLSDILFRFDMRTSTVSLPSLVLFESPPVVL